MRASQGKQAVFAGNEVGAGGAHGVLAGWHGEQLVGHGQQVLGHGLPQVFGHGSQHLFFLNEPHALFKPENKRGQQSLQVDFGVEHLSHFLPQSQLHDFLMTIVSTGFGQHCGFGAGQQTGFGSQHLVTHFGGQTGWHLTSHLGGHAGVHGDGQGLQQLDPVLWQPTRIAGTTANSQKQGDFMGGLQTGRGCPTWHLCRR